MKGKVAFMKAVRDIEIREYPLPDPDPGAILTEVCRSNICGSDIHIWAGNHPIIKGNMVLGHETIARIAKLGAGVDKDYAGQTVSEGDRIVAPYYLTCQKCPACLKGQFNLCYNAYTHLVKHPDVAPHFHGTLATHFYIHSNQYFYKVPDNVADSVASSTNCAMSQVYYGIDESKLSEGEYLLIQGAGGLGLNATAIAKEKGAIVIVIDGVEDRLNLAKEFGASYTINLNEHKSVDERVTRVLEITGGVGADVGMEVVGKGDAFNEGLQHLRPGGRYIELGIVTPSEMTTFSPAHIVRKGLTIIGAVRYQPWYLHKSLKFLEKFADKYPYEKFSERIYGLEEVSIAFEHAEQRIVARAAIDPGKTGLS